MIRWVAAVFLALTACSGPSSPFAPGVNGAPKEDGLTIGHRLMAAREYDLALSSYTRALGQFGMTPAVAAALGHANLSLGRLGQAEPQLRLATKSSDATPEMWNNLGVLLMERGEYVEAASVFRRAFALSNGQNATIQSNLATALSKRDAARYTESQVDRADPFP
ncbi:MAG: tetratricopeptide repeat protein [Pseudomonadota bacterium]